MYSVLFPTQSSDYDETVTALWELGTVGIIEEPAGLRGFFETRFAAESAARFLVARTLEPREETATASAPVSEDWEPILIGKNFFVASSSIRTPTPAGRVRLTIDAKNAFGSGRHESTQLMMEALETCMKPGMTVLDVGCGSGILAAATQALGAAKVIACDIDPNAISVVRSIEGVSVFTGSADAARATSADLVLANISARVVDAIAPDLNRVAKPGGYIVIAGFVRDQLPCRWQPKKIHEAGEWQCWICDRDPILAKTQVEPARHSLRWW